MAKPPHRQTLPSKFLRTLNKQLRPHGYHIVRRNNQHCAICPLDGDGPKVWTSGSPSDVQAERNILRDIRNVLGVDLRPRR